MGGGREEGCEGGGAGGGRRRGVGGGRGGEGCEAGGGGGGGGGGRRRGGRGEGGGEGLWDPVSLRAEAAPPHPHFGDSVSGQQLKGSFWNVSGSPNFGSWSRSIRAQQEDDRGLAVPARLCLPRALSRS